MTRFGFKDNVQLKYTPVPISEHDSFYLNSRRGPEQTFTKIS